MEIKRVIKDKMRTSYNGFNEKYYVYKRRKYEVRKFKDIKRKKIYDSVSLSEQQRQQIDDLYTQNYGEKIPYVWHKYYTAYTGNFDYRYFPELLFIPEFEYYMNYNKNYVHTFADKNIIPYIASNAGVKTPDTVISCANGILRNSDNHIVGKEYILSALKDGEEYFIKPTLDSSSGRGCRLYICGGGEQLDIDSLILELNKNFTIQRRIKNSKSISYIYPDAVNTFRIITYIWNHQVQVAPIIMRIGRDGSFLDNAHAGGMFIAISNDGILQEKAFTEFNTQFKEHPNTHVLFKGYAIDNFNKCINAAISVHELIPQIGIINWDFTIDEQEAPVLIEANTSCGSIWMAQMAWGKGIFEDNTEDILRWLNHKKNN